MTFKTKLLLNIIKLSHFFDKFYQIFVALRSEIIVSIIDPENWEDFTLASYSNGKASGKNQYTQNSYNQNFFPWEEAAIESFFPVPPARILVAAFGGGREMNALVRKGHYVSGFEPVTSFVRYAENLISSNNLQFCIEASYKDFICGSSILKNLPHFDAVILGWGSISHIGQIYYRQELFSAVRRICPEGPVLFSWQPAAPIGRRQKKIQSFFKKIGSKRVSENDVYFEHAGFVHKYTTPEIIDLINSAQYEIKLLETENVYPHAVIFPKNK